MLSPMRSTTSALLLLLCNYHASTAFVIVRTTTTQQPALHHTRLSMSSPILPEGGDASTTSSGIKANPFLQQQSQQNPDVMAAEPRANPDRPELPEIPGDYDWDAKYAGDADWISDPNQIPGKRVMNEIELAAQVSALDRLEEQWRKERDYEQYEESKNVGFVSKAELLNGRTAMFFLATGLLTEYWTGVSMPGQVEEMLRILGVIGFE